MECVLSGHQIRSFNRAINCLARIGSELMIEAVSQKLTLRTLNSSRSAFLAITFKSQFFDGYQLSLAVAQCSVLLKSVCTVFRTQSSNIEHLSISFSDMEATKLQWTLQCFNGIRKTYWITCNHEPDMQHVALDRNSFPSYLVVKPRDLNRLLANFQSSLQEITLIATEQSAIPSDSEASSEGKAVELRSYIDPVKENSDGTLHTQLWIDPSEEFQAYMHHGAAVDVTFSLKELKAFLNFCEGSEADIHFFFESAGKPILLAPRFGLDDSSHADFDATLVLATMLGSQLQEGESFEEVPQPASHLGPRLERNEGLPPSNVAKQTTSYVKPVSTSPSRDSSDHTRIWSELSGSASKSGDVRKVTGTVHVQGSADASEEIPTVAHMRFANQATTLSGDAQFYEYNQTRMHTSQMRAHIPAGGPVFATSVEHGDARKRILSNWISEDTEDDDDGGGDDLCVQSTPPERRGVGGS